nr:hypothetical protein [Tanacetum cinerariifolium]
MNEIVTEEIKRIDKDVTDVIRENGMEMDGDEETNQKFKSVNGYKVENLRKVVDDGLKDPDIVINVSNTETNMKGSVKGDGYVNTVNHVDNRDRSRDNSPLNNKSKVAQILSKTNSILDNKLELVPSVINEKGDEVVVFNEELVEEGCEKWHLIIKVQYKDALDNINRIKYVNVEYSWKLDLCEYCSGFGHGLKNCKVRKKSEEEIESEIISKNANANMGNKDFFMKVRSRKTNGNDMGVKNNTTQQNQWNRCGMWNQRNGNYNRGRYVVRQKEASNEDKGNDGKRWNAKMVKELKEEFYEDLKMHKRVAKVKAVQDAAAVAHAK